MTPAEAGAGREALDARVEELYAELRQLAGAAMARQGSQHTLQPTALVNEAWMRLARAGRLDVADRGRFLGLAAKVMRQVLVDHARRKGSQKRSGDKIAAVELREDATPAASAPAVDVLALDRALTELGRRDPRQVEIVEMRYLAGLSVEEVAAALALSPTTIKREASMARAWLLAELSGSDAAAG